MGYIIDELGKKFKIGHHKKRFSFFKILFIQKVSDENFLKKIPLRHMCTGVREMIFLENIYPRYKESLTDKSELCVIV